MKDKLGSRTRKSRQIEPFKGEWNPKNESFSKTFCGVNKTARRKCRAKDPRNKNSICVLLYPRYSGGKKTFRER